MLSFTTVTGSDQVRPPSLDRLVLRAVGPARPAFPRAGFSVKVSVAMYATPSGPNEIHGSLVRSSAPPVHRDTLGSSTRRKLCPPSRETPTTFVCAPPSTL